MSTDVIAIEAKPRERTGSRYARRVREAGGLPAVVYGHKQTPEAVVLDAKETVRQITHGARLFKLSLSGGEDTVILKDIQFDHLGRDVIHVDLERVNLDERVVTTIAVRLKGEAPGMNAPGAVFLKPNTEIEIECTVGNLEDHVTLDISSLEAGDALHASDIPLPHQYKLLTDPDTVMAAITIKEEVEEPEEAAAAEAELAAPEVIGERKDEAEGGGEGESEEKAEA
jgi:large subunit ribosomal protein L25